MNTQGKLLAFRSDNGMKRQSCRYFLLLCRLIMVLGKIAEFDSAHANWPRMSRLPVN
jgi:hypothetical protein